MPDVDRGLLEFVVLSLSEVGRKFWSGQRALVNNKCINTEQVVETAKEQETKESTIPWHSMALHGPRMVPWTIGDHAWPWLVLSVWYCIIFTIKIYLKKYLYFTKAVFSQVLYFAMANLRTLFLKFYILPDLFLSN